MERIRTMLIHWLGGLTDEDIKKSCIINYDMGRYTAYNDILTRMKAFYGTAATDWCDNIYRIVEKNVKDIHSRYNE